MHSEQSCQNNAFMQLTQLMHCFQTNQVPQDFMLLTCTVLATRQYVYFVSTHQHIIVIKILSGWQHVTCMWQSRALLTWFLRLYSACMYMYCIIMKVSGM